MNLVSHARARVVESTIVNERAAASTSTPLDCVYMRSEITRARHDNNGPIENGTVSQIGEGWGSKTGASDCSLPLVILSEKQIMGGFKEARHNCTRACHANAPTQSHIQAHTHKQLQAYYTHVKHTIKIIRTEKNNVANLALQRDTTTTRGNYRKIVWHLYFCVLLYTAVLYYTIHHTATPRGVAAIQACTIARAHARAFVVDGRMIYGASRRH